jgi:hypothetical protein
MSEVYAITDLAGYASQMREAAASSICEEHNDDINDYITLDQMIGLVKQECLGFDDEDRPLLDEKTNETIFENTAVWIHNVGLAKLAAQDLVECAWDDKDNEMIFWTKEKSTNENKRNSRRKNKKNQG